jgi:hypothetical protein
MSTTVMTAPTATSDRDNAGQTRLAHTIVIGNEKGGAGKSTVAMHLCVGLLRMGMKVGVMDLDVRQRSLARYLENRSRWVRNTGAPMPLAIQLGHAGRKGSSHVPWDGGMLIPPDQPGGWRVLVENRPLLLFAAIAFLFHLANAAMLTSVSQLLAKTVGKDSATSLTAACIVAAQLVMVPVAVIVGRNVDAWGRKPLFLVAFGVLAARGALYTLSNDAWWLVGVQALDGVGAGIFGALFPVVIADLTKGSGRFNVAQGAVATAQGLGAALSATLAGTIIVGAGYAVSFLTLAAIAAVGLALYAVAMPETKPKHAAPKAKGHAA